MKKNITTIIAVFAAMCVYAQSNTFPDNGNVGVGTTTPTDKLQVYSNDQKGEIRIGGGNGAGNGRIYIQADFANNQSYIDAYGNNTHKKLSIEASPLILNGGSFGDVGIGTQTPVSIGGVASTLGINSRSSMYSGGVSYMADGVAKGYTYYDNGAMAVQGASGVPIKLMTNNSEVVRVTTGGNFGIGTSTPEARLSVKGIDANEIATFNSSPSGGYLTFKTNDVVRGHLQYGLTLAGNINGNNVLLTNTDQGGSIALQTRSASGVFNMNAMVVSPNGDVGIGTSTLTSDYKLTVAGKVHSQEVKVSIDAGADFVFEKNYALQPLSEVAKYISSNKHLPEIPSASEMKKNGLELGEMNIKLLQKIEELTLHLIEQNKLNMEQSKLIHEQTKRIEKLEKAKND